MKRNMNELITRQANNSIMRRHYSLLILAIVLISSVFQFQCSSPTTADEIITLTVTPPSGPPGTVLKVTGVTGLNPATNSLSATIGGNIAPVIIGDSGQVLVSIPLFLDDSGLVVVPAGALDLTLFSNGKKLGEARNAIMVESLPTPTHSLADFTTSLETISATLDTVISSFSISPGIEEQYVQAILVGLDSLLNGSDSSSLASATGGINGDSSLSYITEILDANGVIEGFMNMAEQLQAISAPATANIKNTPLDRSTSPLVIPTLLTDQDLARRMQFYVIVKMFGETVIAQTGQTFAETVGLAAGVIGIGGGNVPYVTVVSAVLTFIDVLVNKIIVGALPATIDSMSVSFGNTTIHPDDTTEATVYILASNLPPSLTVQDLVGLTLTTLGLMGNSQPIQSFKEVLLNTVNFFVSVMQASVAAYSAQHPELNLDVNVTTLMPPMKWEAYIDDPNLVSCQSLTPSIVTGMTSSPNWQANNVNYGEGRVYVMPATGSAVLQLPLPPGFTYNGGAFGLDMTASRTKSLWVKPELALQVDFANTITVGGANVLGIDAGYYDSQGNFYWAPNIDISLSVTDGSANIMSGLTDAQGHFSSIITIDSTADSVAVHITADGDYDSQADTIVVARTGVSNNYIDNAFFRKRVLGVAQAMSNYESLEYRLDTIPFAFPQTNNSNEININIDKTLTAVFDGGDASASTSVDLNLNVTNSVNNVTFTETFTSSNSYSYSIGVEGPPLNDFVKSQFAIEVEFWFHVQGNTDVTITYNSSTSLSFDFNLVFLVGSDGRLTNIITDNGSWQGTFGEGWHVVYFRQGKDIAERFTSESNSNNMSVSSSGTLIVILKPQ